MFGTTLTDEYLRISETFGFDVLLINQLVINGIRASLLSTDAQRLLEIEFRGKLEQLQNDLNL